MMLPELLEEIARHGVKITVVGEKLRFYSDCGAVPESLVGGMREHKAELIRHLQSQVVTGVESSVTTAVTTARAVSRGKSGPELLSGADPLPSLPSTMPPLSRLLTLAARGHITLRRDGRRVVAEAPDGKISPELRRMVADNQRGLLAAIGSTRSTTTEADMVKVEAILSRCADRGIRLYNDSAGHLSLDAPAAVLTPAILSFLVDHAEELLEGVGGRSVAAAAEASRTAAASVPGGEGALIIHHILWGASRRGIGLRSDAGAVVISGRVVDIAPALLKAIQRHHDALLPVVGAERAPYPTPPAPDGRPE